MGLGLKDFYYRTVMPLERPRVIFSEMSKWVYMPPFCQIKDIRLFRPPGPAAAGRAGLYILLLCFLSFFARTHRWESANHATDVTAPTVEPPHPLLKYPQTFDPRCPLFHRGDVPNFCPKFDPGRLRTAVFLNLGTLSENKNKLVKDRL